MSNAQKLFIYTDLAQLPLDFNENDPFPLLPEDSYSYEDAKYHSVLVDKWLGLPAEEHHTGNSDAQTWQHLSVQQFQTPYCEIRCILERLQLSPGQTLVDLGCAYARFAFVMHRHFPDVNFKGYEIDLIRVQKVQERFRHFQMHHSSIEIQNITAPCFIIPKAEAYFLFDFGHTDEIIQLLEKLKVLAQKSSFQVVGRGRATRHFIQEKHPWLSQVNDPQHTRHYSIYKC